VAFYLGPLVLTLLVRHSCLLRISPY
jgi:hypothetical protein